MKKNLQHTIFYILFFIFLMEGKEVRGQWVTIPDTAFVSWLNANGYASCMNGNLMDTTCNNVISDTSVICVDKYIKSIEGIQFFSSLKYLDCSDNDIDSISILPQSIRYLNVAGNNLSALPLLPDSTETLSCGLNQFSGFSSLPNFLITFSCDHNPIDSLPSLPGSLQNFYCNNCNLQKLPALPDSIKKINCSVNQLTNLPTLPIALTDLKCTLNQLDSLPALPIALKNLECRYNQLVSLPSLPPSISFINCYNNNISTLPLLPNSLITLWCGINGIVSIPNLPSSLWELDCSNNQLSSLPGLPPNLRNLNCGANQLTSLPQLPLGLERLNCSYNLISNLPALPSTLTHLWSVNCSLVSLPELPDIMHQLDIYDNPNLRCLPRLKMIFGMNFSNTGISCVPNLGYSISSIPDISTFPLCYIFNTNGCEFFWNISGKVYADSISNCLYDNPEKELSNLKLKLFKDSALIQETFSNQNGNFTLDTDTGNFTFTVDTTDLPFYVSCPLSGFDSCYIPSNDTTVLDKDFGLICKPGFDVGVNTIVRDSGIVRPAHFAKINIKAGDMSNKYGRHCASGVSGTVTVIMSGPASYISASNGSLIPTLNGDTLTYSIADFGTVNFNTDFSIIIFIDTTAIIGDTVCFDVSVIPTTGDIYPANNILQECFNVVSSYDPNEKIVFPINRIHNENGKLTYTINFQNTGTAPAQHIYILDTLDAAIDESSFELLAYSHQPQVQIIGNVVRFNFPNINLPDSVNDEPNSHGYVQYRVKLKDSLALGTVISNTSYIYFDFNAPVQTNTVIDTLTDCNNLAAIDVINQTLCAGDTLLLNAALAYPASTDWYVDSVFVSGNQSISIPNLAAGNHEIKLVATNAYCNTEVVSNVVIHPLPIIELGNDTSTCNIPVTLDAGAGNISYQWSNGETTQTIIANSSSLYSVVVTDANGCLNTDSVTVTINALPAQPVITQNISLLTSSYSTGNQWLMNGMNITGAVNNTYNVTQTGWYSVMFTDSNGCSSMSDSIYMDLSGVSDVSNTIGSIRIVPNPAKNQFEVWGLEFEVNDIVTITDAPGNVVYQTKIKQPTSNLKLQTSNYLSGIYFVNIRTAKFSAVLKLVKE